MDQSRPLSCLVYKIHYDTKGKGRVCRVFPNVFQARQFYVKKFVQGKNPKLKVEHA